MDYDINGFISVTSNSLIVFRFARSVSTLRIHEDVAIGSLVGQVVATDDDFGENARIKYELVPPNSMFSVNDTTGELLLVQSKIF